MLIDTDVERVQQNNFIVWCGQICQIRLSKKPLPWMLIMCI